MTQEVVFIGDSNWCIGTNSKDKILHRIEEACDTSFYNFSTAGQRITRFTGPVGYGLTYADMPITGVDLGAALRASLEYKAGIIICLGTNDSDSGIQTTTPQIYQDSLHSLLCEFRDKGVISNVGILTSLRKLNEAIDDPIVAMRAACQAEANLFGIPCIDGVQLTDNDPLMYDNTNHLNSLGRQTVANRLCAICVPMGAFGAYY